MVRGGSVLLSSLSYQGSSWPGLKKKFKKYQYYPEVQYWWHKLSWMQRWKMHLCIASSHNIQHPLSSQLFSLIPQQCNNQVFRMGKIAVTSQNLLNPLPAPLTQRHSSCRSCCRSAWLPSGYEADTWPWQSIYSEKHIHKSVIVKPKPVRAPTHLHYLLINITDTARQVGVLTTSNFK